MKYKQLKNYVSLRQGLAINSGTSYLISERKSKEFIYPLLRIADMMENKFSKYVSKDINPSVISTEEDIIYTRTGQIGLAFRGFVGVVHNNSFIVSIINDAIDKDYLFTLLQWSFVRRQALKLAQNSVQPDLTHNMFKSIVIPVFDKETQKKISIMYNILTNKINLNRKINTELEAMTKTLYDYWFLQFEFPNEEGKPYKSSGGKMVWNEKIKREIPEGWEVDILEKHIKLTKGISYTSKNIENKTGIPMINLASIDINRNYRPNELKYYDGEYNSKKEVFFGDMLIACTDLTRNADIIGSPILVPNDREKYVYSMDLAKLEVIDNTFNPLYLYMTLRTDFYHNYIKGFASGTNVLHLNIEGISWFNTCIPLKEVQDNFGAIIEVYHAKKCQIIKENQELIALRDVILPLLMNGQIGFKSI